MPKQAEQERWLHYFRTSGSVGPAGRRASVDRTGAPRTNRYNNSTYNVLWFQLKLYFAFLYKNIKLLEVTNKISQFTRFLLHCKVFSIVNRMSKNFPHWISVRGKRLLCTFASVTCRYNSIANDTPHIL